MAVPDPVEVDYVVVGGTTGRAAASAMSSTS
jgi:hypothetical protein